MPRPNAQVWLFDCAVSKPWRTLNGCNVNSLTVTHTLAQPANTKPFPGQVSLPAASGMGLDGGSQ